MRRASANFAPPRDNPSATSLSTDATLSTEECTPSSTNRWYRSRTRALKRSVCGLPRSAECSAAVLSVNSITWLIGHPWEAAYSKNVNVPNCIAASSSTFMDSWANSHGSHKPCTYSTFPPTIAQAPNPLLSGEASSREASE